MTFFSAAIWSVVATCALQLMAELLREAGRLDLVSGVLCQAAAFLGTLIFFTLTYEKDRPLPEVLGLRRTSVALCAVAAATGVALQGPLTLVSDAIYHVWPMPEERMRELEDLFRLPLLHQKIAVLLCAGVLGPAVEEMFFRGALFRALRRRHPPGLTVVGVALLFALAHLEPRDYLPVLLGGMAMGYVRSLAGSLWPALFLHASFNLVSTYFALRVGLEADVLSRPASMAGVLATVVLIVFYRALALRSETCAQARAADIA
jgi:membrane protease YdiL (CAAX protease family)